MKRLKILITLLIVISSLVACNESKEKNEMVRTAVKEKVVIPQAKIEQVSTDLVCMVNNAFMGKPQIEVMVDGKIYYGCCAGCEAKLQADRSQRYAIDPISKNEVDKATAFIAKLPNDDVLYFESIENLNKYRL